MLNNPNVGHADLGQSNNESEAAGPSNQPDGNPQNDGGQSNDSTVGNGDDSQQQADQNVSGGAADESLNDSVVYVSTYMVEGLAIGG